MARVGLNGHDRAGTAFPHPPGGYLYTLNADNACTPFGLVQYPSVGVTSDGALAVWSRDDGLCMQRVGLDLKPKAPAFKWPAFMGIPGHVTFPGKESAVQRMGTGWWLGVSDQRGLWSVRATDTEVVSVEPLVHYSPADCFATDKCAEYNTYQSDRVWSAVWKDELWVGVLDQSGTNTQSKYRVLRVAPGCVYPSIWDVMNP